jgi:hypothetical protein
MSVNVLSREVTMFPMKQLHVALVAFLVTILFISSPGLSSARDLSDFCTQAKSLLDQNQPIKAMEAIQKAMEEVWRHTPFQLGKAVLVKKKATAFGIYEPRPDNLYKPGEVVFLYLEPVGFTQQEKDGHYFMSLAADFTVQKEDGTIIGGKENFGKWELNSQHFITGFYMNLDYTLTNLKPGTYIIKTVLRDLPTSKAVSVDTPVRFE